MEDSEESSGGVPEWVVTYGDMMSLLLTFFIMLVSMSELKSDHGKARRALDAIRKAFGPTKFTSGAPGFSFQETSIFGKRSSRGKRSQGGMDEAGKKSDGVSGAHVPVTRISDGTLIVLGGAAQFRRFDAELTPELKKSLDTIAKVVGPKTNQIMIRGHASPEPLPDDRDFAAAALGCQFPWPQRRSSSLFQDRGVPLQNQFDLSFARARNVADYLVGKKIDRRRLIVTAAGDSEIRLHTRRQADQKWNRRVDVFLLDSYITHPAPAP